MQHTDSWFNSVAMGNGAIGTTAGTLEAFLIGTSQYKSPETIFGKTLIDGKWKSKAGNWHNFKELGTETNGFKKQSLKVSQHWAKQRSATNLKVANGMKLAGKVTFILSIGFAATNIYKAKKSNDSNKNEVYVKNALDVTMGIVAFIPVYGWAISGTYFLLDAGGAFGNFGQASGFSVDEANAMHTQRQKLAKNKLEDVIFEFDLEPTAQQQIYKMKEQQIHAQDHTYVAPRTLFKTDFK